MAASPSPDAQQGNYGVDYVIRYTFGGRDHSGATKQLEKLLRTLAEVGFQTEVRHGDKSSLLVFVRAPSKSLQRATYTSRVRDWLYGLRHTQPGGEQSPEPQTDAERLRVIHYMITSPREDGGAGITPKHGEWKNVDSIFALHDNKTNEAWMRDWSKKTFLTRHDLDQIRNKFGERVGFYFAFLQSYFGFLLFPALFGFSCWLLLGYFSPIYAIVNCLWCVIFVEYWKRQEIDFGIRWQVRGVSVLPTKNRQFKPEKEVRDETTGEVRQVFPWRKRLLRQLLQIPFALVAASVLGAIIATCFAIEIFISEVYNGPLKGYLVFIPTILLSSLIPTFSAVLTSVATRLNDFENYETKEAYDVALIQKILVLNFITSYLPIFLTAFVYVPFANVIVPYLDVFRVTVRPFVSAEDEKMIDHADFRIDPSRLRKQVIYFTVTAQIVNTALETVVPFVLRKLSLKYREFTEERQEERKGHDEVKKSIFVYDDLPEEAEFLSRVRNEAELPEYDVTTDLREMCIQFGYLSLFSPVWPLVPVSFLINNWVELRSDFFKICRECKRPTPERTDTIGPWLDTLGLLAWVGSITSSALVYMFSNDRLGPDGQLSEVKGWALLLTVFFAEHIYLAIRYAVEATMSKIDTPSMREERAQQFLLRKNYLGATLDAGITETGETAEKTIPAPLDGEAGEQAAPSERFWTRQKTWKEAAGIGANIIESHAISPETKKQQ
ncbi:hypothetical protein VTN77DRAFT_5739 [Rasamsonia byssochlamydoides]|uniref:uncharacterized protein n=1 Tax=Rasamsonia byssochlamydoides TaxID=89139 RepID=UPI0037436101